ncbi:hypothetical protein K239x_29470 [Planctomycetes bacterium K23_9]|uniref:Uncharacterized protein n=1 Tax=Stieleria marina TaxID=1930275 RepID=A0A517NV00_9BACT|nr:hypothetical protein K239x_29470 [Planctomycetes bacterium K23_9]
MQFERLSSKTEIYPIGAPLPVVRPLARTSVALCLLVRGTATLAINHGKGSAKKLPNSHEGLRSIQLAGFHENALHFQLQRERFASIQMAGWTSLRTRGALL